MILTCPECATGYFVDDAQIRPGGRTVKCAACGARWTAHPDTSLDSALELSDAQAGGEVAAPAGSNDEGLAPLTGDDLPKAFRARATTQQRLREAAVTGAIWGGMAVVLALIVGAAVVFRVDVVRLLPRTAAAYASVGLPVNRLGLVIEGVRADPALQDGHAALSVSGMIRNIEDHAVITPPLRIVLYNAQGKRVAGQIATPADARIPPGETRHFAIAILDPPLSAHDLEVAFAEGVKTRTAPRTVGAVAVAPIPGPGLRGAAGPEPLPLAPTGPIQVAHPMATDAASAPPPAPSAPPPGPPQAASTPAPAPHG